MVTFTFGRPDGLPTPSIFLTISIPSTTSPKTTCLPSSHDVTTVVMKNYWRAKYNMNYSSVSEYEWEHTWEPLVLGPALAMERRPGLSWRSLKFSSTNLPWIIMRYRTMHDTYRWISLHISTFHRYLLIPSRIGLGISSKRAHTIVTSEITTLKHELLWK